MAMYNNTLNIIQHNVIKWNRRKLELCNIYRNINADIILINSHCLPNNNSLKIPGYKVYQTNTMEYHSDGCAIAIKYNIKHKPIHDFISDILALEIETTTGNIVVSTMYQPPSRDYIPTPDFITLFRRNYPVYMIADLNANHQTFGYARANVKGRQLFKMIQNKTIQHIGPHFSTFYSSRRGTNPDIILTNYRTHHNILSIPGPLTTSDHIPIIITISSSPILLPIQPRSNFAKANWQKFKENINLQIQNTNLEEATPEEIDTSIESWYTTILNSINNNIPKTYYRQLPAPVLSHESQTIITVFNAIRDFSDRHGWSNQHYQTYKQLQNILHDKLTNEYNTSWCNLIQHTTKTYKDPHIFWKKIKNIMGLKNPEPKYIYNNNKDKIYTPEEKEGIYRELWENVFQEEEDQEHQNAVAEENLNKVNEYLNANLHRLTPYNNTDFSRLNSNLIDNTITPEDILYYIKLTKKTAPGNSGINKTIMSKLPQSAIVTLSHIYNASMSIGYFPDSWKESTIKLIPKTGKDPHDVNNYRPISLLEVPGKIYERIINARLKRHLEITDAYHDNQFGFRTQRGTHHALALITEQIAQYKSDKGQCQVILRDISKAFDKVWHIGLKYKILHLKLPITIEKLLCDFLDDRYAKIKIDNFTGPKFELQTGVPQGSVLSPTLFTIYTSDIPTTQIGVNIAYADDITQIFGYAGKSKEMLNRRTERGIAALNQYEQCWKIKTNINKFTPIHLSA